MSEPVSASRPFLGRHARIGLVAAVAAGACLAPVSAAVIPLGFDKQEVGGPGARLPDSAAAQLPVAQVVLAGRTLVFAVRTRACDNRATYAVLTIVSPQSAQLDLETSSRPITFKLSKVG